MKTLSCAVGAAVLVAIAATPSLAKRAMPPQTEICNKTKDKQYIATMSYAGRGHQTTSGWTFIAPGECRTFRDDRYFVRGSARTAGFDRKSSRRGCVKNTKRFDITAPGGDVGDKKHCKQQDGYLVDFRSPKPDSRRQTAPIVIGP